MTEGTARLLVFGAGAVGSLVGGLASAAGADVVLVGRRKHLEVVDAHGLRVVIRRRVLEARPRVAYSLQEGAGVLSPDLVVVSMKAGGTAEAARAVAGTWPRAEDRPAVLTLQNGVGNEETLGRVLGMDKVLSGTLTAAVAMDGPGRVIVAGGRGGLALADAEAPENTVRALDKLCGGFASGGLPAVMVACDYRALKWSKLLLNILGNATCAILDLSPAEALAHRGVFMLERAAFREAVTVMDAAGIPACDLPGYPVRWLRRLLPGLPAPLAHRLLYRSLARGRGNKPPSFLLDLRAGRTTEVSFLNGAVAGTADRLGLPAPVNAALTRCLDEITAGTAPWDDFRGKPSGLFSYVYGLTS